MVNLTGVKSCPANCPYEQVVISSSWEGNNSWGSLEVKAFFREASNLGGLSIKQRLQHRNAHYWLMPTLSVLGEGRWTLGRKWMKHQGYARCTGQAPQKRLISKSWEGTKSLETPAINWKAKCGRDLGLAHEAVVAMKTGNAVRAKGLWSGGHYLKQPPHLRRTRLATKGGWLGSLQTSDGKAGR